VTLGPRRVAVGLSGYLIGMDEARMPRGTGIGTRATQRIDAPAEVVWRAITTPELIERWFFGVRTESGWTEGSSIVHRGEYQGAPYEDRGTILEIRPPSRLVHTHWSEVSGLPDAPEHHQVVTYDLEERDGGTLVTVTETNLPSEQAKAVSEQAWPVALGALRDLVEA
jgi:uncharacterized protein YndB with AHSA1/START domain